MKKFCSQALLLSTLTAGAFAASNEPLSKQPWSNFGSISKNYVEGRQEHSNEAFAVLTSQVSSDVLAVDLGCGTGISTRQLLKHGYKNVLGCDRDPVMLGHALSSNTPENTINYVQGNVSTGLPFNDNQFELATAFSAIHWFADPSSINEIKRILKPKGYFFVVGNGKESNKSKNSIRAYCNQLIKEATGKPLPEKGVDPAKILKEQGFKIIFDSPVPSVKYYTKQQALAVLQSRSYWNLIKDTPHKDEILNKLDRYLDTLLDENGLIKQEDATSVVLAQKQ